jgi:hypothetical protein
VKKRTITWGRASGTHHQGSSDTEKIERITGIFGVFGKAKIVPKFD